MTVVPLRACSKESIDEVGGKSANLGEMLNHGFAVPDGFAVTVDAYQRALGGILDEAAALLAGLSATDMPAVEEASARVRGLIRACGMPGEIRDEVARRYAELSAQYGQADVPVAVRSSATAEDLPDASFAGQQDTYLWVTGEDVAAAVVDCWASLFTARAVCYRMKNAIPHEQVSMGVCVQKMVDSRVAGVMFTINPLNGDRSKITIGGSWGLGESVVSGCVNPDEWMVDKVILEICRRTVVPKAIMHDVDLETRTVVVRDVPADKREMPCLSDAEIIRLAHLGKAVERHYGAPQDIEWAIEKALPFPESMFLVQSRPETVWSGRKAEPVVGAAGAGLSGQVCDYLTKVRA